MSERKREIVEIPARPHEKQDRLKRQLRVAAYCRVSTNQESQQNSYQTQKAYYTDKIASNPDWILVDIFADEGNYRNLCTKAPGISADDTLLPARKGGSDPDKVCLSLCQKYIGLSLLCAAASRTADSCHF